MGAARRPRAPAKREPGRASWRPCLGTVEFKVECSAAAQDQFNHAMALYHSFAWPEAAAAFAAVSPTADPACGMAHWGRAMVMLDNPFLWPGNLPPEKLDAVAEALEQARSAGLASEREQGYVEALEAFVRDRDRLDHRTRVQAFEEALGEVAADNPDDMEASILHALVTSANFDPADRTYANQMRAAEILEPLFESHPDHPGVAHYLIHTYDYPPLAEQGLEAASRYAGIAPDAVHALHMPSHIFTRVGYWEDSIASNMASAKADGGKTLNTHHAYDYMVYAHLQLAQDQAAQKALKQARTPTRSITSPPRSPMPPCRPVSRSSAATGRRRRSSSLSRRPMPIRGKVSPCRVDQRVCPRHRRGAQRRCRRGT
jgi:hypothetical protein